MKRKCVKSNKKFVTSLVVFATIFILVFPSINAAIPKDFGIVWIYDGDDELLHTKKDAQGFRDKLLSDGWNKVFEKSEGEAHDEQWETSQDQYYVDNVHIAYYAGHGYKTYLAIHKKGNPAGRPEERAEWYNCNWGDENYHKNNWMALATCLAGYWWFGYSMHGTHLVLGWKTQCKDAEYGETFGYYLIDKELTLKQAWFETGKLHGKGGHWMRVLGETSSMGNDHLPGHGYVNPDPSDDNIFVYWDCKVPSGGGGGVRW